MTKTALEQASAKRRNAQLAQIHILRKELAMSEDAYRSTMQQVTGKRSAADLSMQQLRLFIAHLKSIKAKYNTSKKPKHRYPLTTQERLIWSLWQQLADAGAIKDRKMSGLMGYVKTHISGADHISWLSGEQQVWLIEQLKMWLKRYE